MAASPPNASASMAAPPARYPIATNDTRRAVIAKNTICRNFICRAKPCNWKSLQKWPDHTRGVRQNNLIVRGNAQVWLPSAGISSLTGSTKAPDSSRILRKYRHGKSCSPSRCGGIRCGGGLSIAHPSPPPQQSHWDDEQKALQDLMAHAKPPPSAHQAPPVATQTHKFAASQA
jgi:hypothetical protein